MFSPIIARALSFALLAAAAGFCEASSLRISPNSTSPSASAVEGNYTTTHLYVDEIAGDSIPVTIFFDPQTLNVETAEVLTNLNRRERAQLDADGDGIEDGIKAPNANNIPAGNDANYYKAYTMTGVAGGYQITLQAQKTGAYRLTARYRLNGDVAGTYRYYTAETGTDGILKRDHALVISPVSARTIQLYEVNPLTINATGTLPSQRGTLADLAGGVLGGPRFNLQYVKDLGCNMLWFQPVHPNGIDGRQTDPATSQPFEVGSPYAVKNFFEVAPLLAKAFIPGGTPSSNDTAAGRAQAMSEFQSFNTAADSVGVSVMLDAPFNHTSFDTELANLGQTFFGNQGTTANSEMRNTEARFFSRTSAYDMRASSASNIAIAPDRIAEFKFDDTHDVFYGRYAALESGSTGGHTNEGDWFDYSIGDESLAGDGNGHFDGLTQKVWRYFAEYTLFWLTQTGYPANLNGASLNSTVGIDALRADFGQGLPPQCWEYIINKTRTRRWNFIFMAESLDGGAVTYRSGRHFDILNENIVFPLHAAQTTNDFRTIYDNRRNAYGQALVLLNSSSHDEDHYQDPFQAVIRYAVNSSIDGVPLIFPGQELGISGAVVPPGDTQSGITPFGYDRYETNFGKPVPHFKKYNSLMPLWLKTQAGSSTYNFGLAQLSAVYSGVGQARKFSVALRSSNRYYLNLRDSASGGDTGAAHSKIFSVAKYQKANTSPGLTDVVLAFVNLDKTGQHPTPNTSENTTFYVNVTQGGSNLFGINSGRTYNVRNIAAYTGQDNTRRNTWLWGPNGRTGSDVLANGAFVSLNPVPTSDGGWTTAPYEAQFLKVYDVGAPSTPAPQVARNYVIGNSVTFTWSPDGNVNPTYRVNLTLNGTSQPVVTTTSTSYTYSGSPGDRVSVSLQAINPDNSQAASQTSNQSLPVKLLDPNADDDGDGMTNAAEDLAGTDPLGAASVFRVTSVARTAGMTTITWSSVAGKQYQVETATAPNGPFAPLGNSVTATSATANFADSSAGTVPKFYRVRLAQ